MKRRIAFAFLAALAVAAASPIPDDSIRQGNEAFAREDFEKALLLYQQAEERGADPGLIAFNEATAYYRLKDYRQAENHYRMALGDAAISQERRAKAFFNLGDALVQQAGDKDADALREAVRNYQHCLEVNPEEGLRNDATHNLELAKLLWTKARAQDPRKPTPNDERHEPETNPNDQNKDNKEPDHNDAGNDQGPNKLELVEKDPNGKSGDPDDQKKMKSPVPGMSRQPVISDKAEVEQRSKEDTLEALKIAEQRLRDERRRNRDGLAVPDKPNGKDW